MLAEHGVESVAQSTLILLLQLIQEEAPDARDVRRAGLREAGCAFGRDHRVRAAAIGGAALAPHQALPLEAVDEARHAAAREQRGVGQLAHAQMLVAALVEHEQHLVLGHREAVRLLELGVELGRARGRGCAAGRARRQARGGRAGPQSLSPFSNFTAGIGRASSLVRAPVLWRRGRGHLPRGDPLGDGATPCATTSGSS